jgi:hypothetical protein
MMALALEKALVYFLWAGIGAGILAGVLVLAGCNAFTSTEIERITYDPDGHEIREIQRQEFDSDAFERYLAWVIANAPAIYETALTIKQKQLILRQQELELARAKQEMDEAEFQARMDVIVDALARIDQRLWYYKTQASIFAE